MIPATFVLSAAEASGFPKSGLPEIAMVGRSNVGKSSLINALLAQKIARTSAAPGKTRLVNYYLIEHQSANPQSRLRPFYLVDLPGYGYARGGRESVEAFETLTRQYFDPASQPERHLMRVLHLIDARHPDLPHDAAAYGWLFRTGLPITIVATKIDKLNRSEQAKALRALEKKYDTTVLATSVQDGTGLDAIWKMIRDDRP